MQTKIYNALPSVPCIECLIYSHLTSSPFSKLGEPFLTSDSDFLFEYLSSRVYVKLKNIDDSIKFYINGRSLRYEVFKSRTEVDYDWIPSSGEYKTLNFLSECYKSAKDLANCISNSKAIAVMTSAITEQTSPLPEEYYKTPGFMKQCSSSFIAQVIYSVLFKAETLDLADYILLEDMHKEIQEYPEIRRLCLLFLHHIRKGHSNSHDIHILKYN